MGPDPDPGGTEIWKETMCSALNGRKEEEKTEWRRRRNGGGWGREGGGRRHEVRFRGAGLSKEAIRA